MTSSADLLQRFVEKHVAEVEPLNTQAAIASWNMECTGLPEWEEKAAAFQTEAGRIYTRKDEYELLKSVPSGDIADPLLARIYKRLYNAYRGSQIDPAVLEEIIRRETALASAFNNFRAELNGEKATDNELEELLKKSSVSDECRAAWEASKQIGAEVAERVVELARIKNREAQRLGFSNYYQMALELQEVPQDWLFSLLDDLKEKSDPIFEEFKDDLDTRLAQRFGISVAELRPWHYGDRFFQSPPKGDIDLDPLFADKDIEKLTTDFFEAIGLPLGPMLANSDLYERAGKCQHAFCTHIDQKGDVRVLCNVKPTERWMGTMLHEYGHAVYEYYTDFELPYPLRGAAHTLTTEAIAILMGGLVHNAAWLARYTGVSDEDARAYAAEAQQQDRAQKIIFMRWVFVVSRFERAMAEDPEQDLNTLWWDLVEKYQRLKRPEGRNAPDWASKIHVALYPAYYHNYLLGEMNAAQLRHVLRTQVVSNDAELVGSPKVGEFLIDRLFKLAARYDWRETIRRSTGEELNPQYLVSELA